MRTAGVAVPCLLSFQPPTVTLPQPDGIVACLEKPCEKTAFAGSFAATLAQQLDCHPDKEHPQQIINVATDLLETVSAAASVCEGSASEAGVD
jgi:hypothetical protein